MSGKILVTGASGNIGRSLVNRLAEARVDFAVLRSRDAPPLAEVPPAAEIEVRRASFADPLALTRHFEGIDTLFVVLPLVPDKLALAGNVARAAVQAGVQHIVRSSAVGANPESAYSLLRLQGEVDRTFEDTGIPTTFLRPASFMQNLTGYLASQIRAGALYAANGQGLQSPIDVRDIADAAAVVLREPALHAGRAYTLTGEAAFTNAQVVALISAAIGKPVQCVDVPAAGARNAMLTMGLPEEVVEWLLSLNRFIESKRAAGITHDLYALTGHTPRTLEDFVRENAGVWR